MIHKKLIQKKKTTKTTKLQTISSTKETMTSTTATSTTTTTNAQPNTNHENENSCSALDLSWLSESVMEAALTTKHLKLDDVAQFHDSLRAAEELGAMDHDTSERLHHKIDDTRDRLLRKMVAHETARISKRLGLYLVLKAHKTWDQVQFMADMHGQGAFVDMKDFEGLMEEDLQPGLDAFHAYCLEARRTTDDAVVLPLPFSKPGEHKDFDEQVRDQIEVAVAQKICLQYRLFYEGLVHDNNHTVNGYTSEFLEQLQYTPTQFAAMVGVELPVETEKDKRDRGTDSAYDAMGMKTDDENEDDE